MNIVFPRKGSGNGAGSGLYGIGGASSSAGFLSAANTGVVHRLKINKQMAMGRNMGNLLGKRAGLYPLDGFFG